MDFRQQIGTFFQNRDVKRVQYFILLLVFWVWISLGLVVELKSNSVFLTLKAVLQTKILLLALLFGGRYLFFPMDRWRIFFKYSAAVFFLIICGTYLYHDWKWLSLSWRACLQMGDLAVWSAVLAALTELVAALFRKWRHFQVDPPVLKLQWDCLSKDLIKLGFFTLFELTILYYYLINLFMVDTFYYSYLALLLFGACGAALYEIWYVRLLVWADVEIGQIDEGAAGFMKIDISQVRDILPWYQYLILTRNYLEKLRRPQVVFRCLLFYLICGAFLWALPFLLGLAVPV